MSVAIRYLGWSSFEITTASDKKIIIDPFLNDNPYTPLKSNDIERADIILVTHPSRDHLGQAFEIAKRTGATLGCGADTALLAEHEGVPAAQVKHMCPGAILEKDGIVIRSVWACHPSGVTINGQRYSGLAMGWMVKPEPNLCIYHPGDTQLIADFKIHGEVHKPDVAMINVSRFDIGNYEITPYESSLAIEWLGSKLAIPMHFAPGSKDAQEFVNIMKERLPHVKVAVMKPTEVVRYPS